MTCEHDKIVEVLIPGAQGASGTTFTPSVSADGILTWTNDGGRENPPSADIGSAIVASTAQNVALAQTQAGLAAASASAAHTSETAAQAAMQGAEAANASAQGSATQAASAVGSAQSFANAADASAGRSETAYAAAVAAKESAEAARNAAQQAKLDADADAVSASASATAASASASAASASATSASTSASAAATSATQAQASATAAAGSATACVAIVDGAVESITEGVLASDQLAAEARKVRTLQRQVANLRAAAQGQLYVDESDSDAAYAKAVPSGAMPYAALESIGGKSVVFNQILPTSSVAAQSVNGVSVSRNADGTITVNGTATALCSFVIVARTAFSVTAGHKYLLRGCPSGHSTSVSYLIADIYDGSAWKASASDIGSGIIFTPSYTSVSVAIKVPSGASCSSETFAPQLFDLTAMFGAGNEPTTVDAFRSMFPDSYYPYADPQISSASVTKVDVQGRNLVDPSTRGQSESTTVANFVSSPLRSGTAYTMSLTPTVTNTGLVFYFHDAAGAYKSQQFMFAKASVVAGQRISSTVVPNTDIAEIRAYAGQGLNECKDIQIEKGSTATAYAPYTKSEVAIPAAIRALPGYGWSAGSVCNEVDFERKVYVRRVERFTLKVSDASSSRFPAWRVESIAEIVGQGVNTLITNTNNLGVTVGANTVSTNRNVFLFDFASVDEANEWLSANREKTLDVIICRATPIETDISDLLPEDIEILHVEPGGSVTFVQSDSTKRLPVPSVIDYEISTSEA